MYFSRDDIDAVYNKPLSKFGRDFSLTLTLTENAEDQRRLSIPHSNLMVEFKRDLTAGLNPAQRHFRLQLAFDTIVKDINPGTVRFSCGQTIYDPKSCEAYQFRTLYYIVKGNVELISKIDTNSKKPIRRFLGAGECFGFWHFLLGSEHATINNSFRRGITCKGIPTAVARSQNVEVSSVPEICGLIFAYNVLNFPLCQHLA